VSTFCSFSRLHLVAALALLSASALCAETVPSYIVTTAADDANGTSANCTDQSLPGAMRDPNCSLRDALAAAASDGANITFDTTVFGANQPVAARTITLGSAGTLSIPANTTITGLPSGGPDFTNLVTISGSGQHQIFSVGSGVANTAISGLNITGGYVDGSTISGGGAIYNAGTLTVSNSSITGNNVLDSLGGGGIFNDVPGVLTIINSTIAGNSAAFSNSFGQNHCNGGGGIYNSDTLIVTNSTITGNSTNLCFVGYGGIFGGGQITNTIVADNYKQTELGIRRTIATAA
jgi:hypothetical protein